MAVRLGSAWTIRPLLDARWPEFVDQHANSSVFHTIGWLTALRITYGYEPIAITTSLPSEKLTNALLFCVVRSWATGDRVVSLPFSDHCEPLVENTKQLQTLYAHLETLRTAQRWTYTELRTSGTILSAEESCWEGKVYHWHRLDLRPSLDVLYEGFHKDCIRRRIRHAERQGLRLEQGRNEHLMRSFYDLIVLTRSRKHIPPQPFEWFQSLFTYLGKEIRIRIAFQKTQPVAGILTLNHRQTMYYKYGASDARLHHLGAIPMLFWEAIREAKSAGIEELDLGRSDVEDQGLIRFKERLGAHSVQLTRWRSPVNTVSSSLEPLKVHVMKNICSFLPNQMLILAGRLVYRHIG